MSQTHKSMLAKNRLKPLHPTYLACVERVRDIPSRERLMHPHYVTVCPFCGVDGKLVGLVKVAAKKQYPNVALLAEGPAISVPPGRRPEIMIAQCTACHEAVDPKAYQSPIWFTGDRANPSFLQAIGK